ncbi:hypothetical protein KFE25_001244 [Diacronema lutheri]|uniref:Uncharacterized protein n=1 Tax=Diacronema lutheri TaxID=2081491 RepID=A0A8J5X6C8_DIALT|nr:hypothetical protein KFE25_001244 [Diacronema lutheri]
MPVRRAAARAAAARARTSSACEQQLPSVAELAERHPTDARIMDAFENFKDVDALAALVGRLETLGGDAAALRSVLVRVRAGAPEQNTYG